MKYIIIATLLSLCLFNSCTKVPNHYVQNKDGFEVDTETASLIIASRLLDSDVTYEDELISISDKLSMVDVVHVLSKDEFVNLVGDSMENGNRKEVVMKEYATLFGYYGNVCELENYTAKDCKVMIEKFGDGISKAIEIHWVTDYDS
jgi:hypothetical protein